MRVSSFGRWAPLLLGCACAESSPELGRTAHPPPSPVHVDATKVAPALSPAAITGESRPEPAAPVTTASTAASTSKKPRVYVKTRFVWIRPEPNTYKNWVGYLWTGESAPLVSAKPISGPGCDTWYAVEPYGFVCVDGQRATLDENDPGYVAAREYAANLGSAWPHQYGETARLTRRFSVEGSPLHFPDLPSSVHDSRTELRRGSTVAFVSEVRVSDTDYLVGWDLSYFPKELVTPLPHSEYRGIELGGDIQLPLALFRGQDRPKFRRDRDGFVDTGEKFARLSHVGLTGNKADSGADRYLETSEGTWVRAVDAVVPTAADHAPWGSAPVRGRGSWIEVSVLGGWLIAYENLKPVFTTLISPGRGGPAKHDEDPTTAARTPLGVFPISGKFATATMEAPGNLIHTAVPWTQNFSGPHSLHAAYWHDDWGDPKSGGCINVSPLDGKRLFGWTEPALPEGWHGVRWLPERGPATILLIHR